MHTYTCERCHQQKRCTIEGCYGGCATICVPCLQQPSRAMVADARGYLVAACQTATGRAALTKLGYGAIIEAPDQGDDASTVTIATALIQEILRQVREQPYYNRGFLTRFGQR